MMMSLLLFLFGFLVHLCGSVLAAEEGSFAKADMPKFTDTDMIELHHLRSFPLLAEMSDAGSFKLQTSGIALRSTMTSVIIVLEFKPRNTSACFLPIVNKNPDNPNGLTVNDTLSWDKRSTVAYRETIDSKYWMQSTFLGIINGVVYRNYLNWIEEYLEKSPGKYFIPQSICSSAEEESCFTLPSTGDTFLAASLSIFAELSVQMHAIIPPRASEVHLLSFTEPRLFCLQEKEKELTRNSVPFSPKHGSSGSGNAEDKVDDDHDEATVEAVEEEGEAEAEAKAKTEADQNQNKDQDNDNDATDQNNRIIKENTHSSPSTPSIPVNYPPNTEGQKSLRGFNKGETAAINEYYLPTTTTSTVILESPKDASLSVVVPHTTPSTRSFPFSSTAAKLLSNEDEEASPSATPTDSSAGFFLDSPSSAPDTSSLSPSPSSSLATSLSPTLSSPHSSNSTLPNFGALNFTTINTTVWYEEKEKEDTRFNTTDFRDADVTEYFSNLIICMQAYQLEYFADALKSCLKESDGFIHLEGSQYYHIRPRHPFALKHDYWQAIPTPVRTDKGGRDISDIVISLSVLVITIVGLSAALWKLKLLEFLFVRSNRVWKKRITPMAPLEGGYSSKASELPVYRVWGGGAVVHSAAYNKLQTEDLDESWIPRKKGSGDNDSDNSSNSTDSSNNGSIDLGEVGVELQKIGSGDDRDVAVNEGVSTSIRFSAEAMVTRNRSNSMPTSHSNKNTNLIINRNNSNSSNGSNINIDQSRIKYDTAGDIIECGEQIHTRSCNNYSHVSESDFNETNVMDEYDGLELTSRCLNPISRKSKGFSTSISTSTSSVSLSKLRNYCSIINYYRKNGKKKSSKKRTAATTLSSTEFTSPTHATCSHVKTSGHSTSNFASPTSTQNPLLEDMKSPGSGAVEVFGVNSMRKPTGYSPPLRSKIPPPHPGPISTPVRYSVSTNFVSNTPGIQNNNDQNKTSTKDDNTVSDDDPPHNNNTVDNDEDKNKTENNSDVYMNRSSQNKYSDDSQCRILKIKI